MSAKKTKNGPAFHRIQSVQVSGGFLDGGKLEFDKNLNCIIGGRGTGKTTVLELIRYALDKMPNPSSASRGRYYRIEKLLESNLGDGSVRVQIRTMDGTEYMVHRTFGEAPVVTNDRGEATDISIGKEIVFGADVYSQDEIEEIADNALFQLQLIDRFILGEVREVEQQVDTVAKQLQDNAAEILKTRQETVVLSEQIKELPDITEKLKGFKVEGGDERSKNLRVEHNLKALRERELYLLDRLKEAYDSGVEEISQALETTSIVIEDVFEVDLKKFPNQDILDRIRENANETTHAVKKGVREAIDAMKKALPGLALLRLELSTKHVEQDNKYIALETASEEERGKEQERLQLLRRQTALQDREKNLTVARRSLKSALSKRMELRARLSELRDKRYALREEVANSLNEKLSPVIHVRLEQFGNSEEYRNLLQPALKGSGLKYSHLIDLIVERIPPSELAEIVQNDKTEALEQQLQIDSDRAMRLIIQLKDSNYIYAIETVELHDRPVIELKDGRDYKDSRSLSTGQKCTTILPILLLESERPLLIDQPEDNLDNAFVYDTVVRSMKAVRDKRQLIFVTHNPNIPVLGEADKVFSLTSDGRRAIVSKAGSVEETRSIIETILEGGPEAFKLRMKRYGY